MRLLLTATLAFTTGLIVSPLASHWIGDAHAQSAPLQAQVIDLAGLKHGDLAATPNSEMRAQSLVVTDHATIGIQLGNVGKRVDPKTDEIQSIVEGSGSMWLGDERRDLAPRFRLP